MNIKLTAGLACCAALLLGACSSNNPSGPEGAEPGDTGAEPGDGGGTETEPTAQEAEAIAAATKAYADARTAVGEATAAINTAETADTAAARKAATDAIEAARKALSAAVAAADTAVRTTEDGSATTYGRTLIAQATVNRYRTAQETIFEDAEASYAWYRKNLVRYTLANGEAYVPRGATNSVTMERTPRTIDTSATDPTQRANPAAFNSDTFKDIMYSEGDMVFSNSGDEFKVDGYYAGMASNWSMVGTIHTGLKLTNAGLVIRVGGTDEPSNRWTSTYTDMRRDITNTVNDADGDRNADAVAGQNGWDLKITFDEPRTRSVADGDTSWTGNGDFYWKGIVPMHDSQREGGEYYKANAFNQPEGWKDLGTYEVWLSNHIGVEKGLEPDPGSALPPHPDDDKQHYLKYAAYGLFVYTADTQTFRGTGNPEGWNGHVGRVQPMHFGYEAFSDNAGQTTADIGEAVTSGKFVGQTLAYEILGDQNLEVGRSTGVETKLLRGDAALTVNIPMGAGTGTVSGTLSNFQEWSVFLWKSYIDDFTVALNAASISGSGEFSGTTAATPAAGFNNGGAGVFKGNFYGPRTDANDLEVAGSWTVGPIGGTQSNLAETSKNIVGSFGAKQRPATPPSSN